MAANNSTNYQMPHANADLATTWAFLEEGISHIITRPRTGVSYPKYMALSTVIYNYCTSSNAPREGVARRSKFFSLRICHIPFLFSLFPLFLLAQLADDVHTKK